MVHLEIMKFVGTPACIADPRMTQPVFEHFLRAPGLLTAYYGEDLEDTESMYIVNVWKSAKHYAALVDDRQAYKSLMQEVNAVFKEVRYDKGVAIDSDPYAVLDAPLTELILVTVHENVNAKLFQRLLPSLVGRIANITDSTSSNDYTWGSIMQDERQFCVVLGSEDVENVDDPRVGAIVDKLEELGTVDCDLNRVALRKF